VATTRRLAAIMFTDMVGSTASAQANEAEALRLRDEQADLVRPLFARHQGREVKSMGDGFLAEFDSALRAVQCAVDIQQHLHERNAQLGSIPIRLRIGVHLGDVEQRQNDIFGDAVNVAARIEPLATPGGICVSGEVFGLVRDKVPNKFEKLPATALKGLKGPIDIYRVELPWSRPETASNAPGPTGIAVIPFDNISPDPNDSYFADGLTEEIITVLSQLRGLRVIARTSMMRFKSTTKGIAEIAKELGVGSVLEGSVRKSGSRLRITAQLISASSEGHLWSKTYDRELTDVFAVQAELAREVTEALRIELGADEGARLASRVPVKADSYGAYLKGRALMRDLDEASLEAARAQFELAISLDPNNAAAFAYLALVTHFRKLWYSDHPGSVWEAQSRAWLARALELDPNLAEVHTSLAQMHWADWDWTAAEREFRLALSLSPSDPVTHRDYGGFLESQGKPDRALEEFSLVESADPLSSDALFFSAQLLVWLRRLDEAKGKLETLEQRRPNDPWTHQSWGYYHLARLDRENALRSFERSEELATERWKPIARARCYCFSGEKGRSRELLKQEEARPEHGQSAAHISWGYAELGDLDDCYRWMAEANKTHNLPFQRVRLDPLFEAVRTDPRYPGLLKTMNLA
jgi:adenylate cyclase